MKLYAAKSNKPRPLDEYIGKDIWIRTEYHDYGRSKSFDVYYVCIVGEETNSYGDFYLCKFCSNPHLLLPIRMYAGTLRQNHETGDAFQKTRLVPSKPLRTYTAEELFEVKE